MAVSLAAPKCFVRWNQKPVTQKTAYGGRKSLVVCPLCHVSRRVKAMMYGPRRETTKQRDTKMRGNKCVACVQSYVKESGASRTEQAFS
jgi:hypothetical protein